MTTVKKNSKEFHLGDMNMDKTETYKYLGETIHNKQKMDEHIKQTKSKP